MEIICTLLTVYFFVILARIVLSWFPIAYGSPMEGVASFLYAITEPVMGPLRAAIPGIRFGGMALDLSPLIVLFGIRLIQAIIC